MKARVFFWVAAVAALVTAGQPAVAGPGFAYSWLSTDKNFQQCLIAASDVLMGLNYPRIQKTRFGVTGDNDDETLYINCEDRNHVSVVLVRLARPKIGEIDALVAMMKQRLEAVR